MSLAVAQAQLADAFKQLRLRWDRARDGWDDDTARQFKEQVIDPLEGRVLALVKSLDHVREMSAAVRRDCGNDP